jgi:23S rRNA (adenine2503-C2)-methyltransferase
MEILDRRGDPELAEIYVARMREDPFSLVEFVDAVDPRYSREEKWVITVSTQFGCPIRCLICDAGGFYRGNLTADEILSEIDYVVKRRAPSGTIGSRKFKIHFARMGEPALNPALLDVLERLPSLYRAPGLIPCIPTIAPASAAGWFEELLRIKRRLYGGGHFQLQFSVNSTDEGTRDSMMPVKKWSCRQIAEFGEQWYSPGDRRVVLNFALARGVEVDPGALARHFTPQCFMVKLTPVNPTESALRSGFRTVLSGANPDGAAGLVEELGRLGFECVVSIGDDREIAIGSNCGQAAYAVLRREGAQGMIARGNSLSGRRPLMNN